MAASCNHHLQTHPNKCFLIQPQSTAQLAAPLLSTTRSGRIWPLIPDSWVKSLWERCSTLTLTCKSTIRCYQCQCQFEFEVESPMDKGFCKTFSFSCRSKLGRSGVLWEWRGCKDKYQKWVVGILSVSGFLVQKESSAVHDKMLYDNPRTLVLWWACSRLSCARPSMPQPDTLCCNTIGPCTWSEFITSLRFLRAVSTKTLIHDLQFL